MITLDVPQGSREWLDARLGIPTASRFDDILTPKTRKLSASADKYIAELVAEWALGMPLDEEATQWMEHGRRMEARARDWYAFAYDVEVQEVGLCLRDDLRVAGSPDGLVGADGGLEIKNFGAKHHVECVLGAEVAKPTQVQGNLWVCEREWWDVVAYNATLPPVVRRIHRNEAYIADLESALDQFLERLEAAKEKMREQGVDGSTEARLRELLERGPVDRMPPDEFARMQHELERAVADGLLTPREMRDALEAAMDGDSEAARSTWRGVREMRMQRGEAVA